MPSPLPLLILADSVKREDGAVDDHLWRSGVTGPITMVQSGVALLTADARPEKLNVEAQCEDIDERFAPDCRFASSRL
jgi:hypothetical protein